MQSLSKVASIIPILQMKNLPRSHSCQIEEVAFRLFGPVLAFKNCAVLRLLL